MRHEMRRTGTTRSGADEWACVACSRRLLLRPPPAYARLVLDEGDGTAAHGGTVDGLLMTADVLEPSGPAPDAADHSWLAEHGIDWDRPPDGS